MSHDDDDGDEAEATSTNPGFVPVAEALAETGFTLQQLRALVGAGCVRTERSRSSGAALMYCSEDLARLTGARVAEPPEQSPLIAELGAITAGYQRMLELALKQTKQAQDHERMLVTAFSKPLDQLGEGSKALVGAVLEQNKQLVQRASDGDSARLQFVQAAETMLRDQRAELREQNELDRKHELKKEVWEGVKKAGPRLLEGLNATLGTDRLDAAMKLKAKLDPAKLAAVIQYKLLGDEEIDLLCKALDLNRAEIEALNAEADAAQQSEPEPEPEPAAPEAAE